jgi:glutathione S-transferase
MAIDLYYMLESPPCRTVLMVAKHLNIELNLKNVDLEKGEHLKEEFVKVNKFTLISNEIILS